MQLGALTLLVALSAQPGKAFFTTDARLISQVKLFRYPKGMVIDPVWEVSEADRSSLVIADVKLTAAMQLPPFLFFLHPPGEQEVARISVDAQGKELQRVEVALPPVAERLLVVFRVGPGVTKASVCRGTDEEDCTAELPIEAQGPAVKLLPLPKAKLLAARRVGQTKAGATRFAVLVEWTNRRGGGNAFDIGLRQESQGRVERGWNSGFEVDRKLNIVKRPKGESLPTSFWWLYVVEPPPGEAYVPAFATIYRSPHSDDEVPLPPEKPLAALPADTLARCLE